MRQAEKRHARNRAVKSAVKTYLGKAERQIVAAPAEDTTETAVRAALSALDRAAQKGILHRNNAARRKSRLMHKLNASKAASV